MNEMQRAAGEVSGTPRNDEIANQTAGGHDVLHFMLVDELSRKLEVELAAMTQERDAMRRGMAEIHDGLEVVYKKYKHLDHLRNTSKLDPWHECVRDFLVAVAIALGYEPKAAQAGKDGAK